MMSRRINPYTPSIVAPVEGSTHHSEILMQSSPLHEFLREETNQSEIPSVTLTSDITMLFNQERLDKLTQVALMQQFDGLTKQVDSLAQIRSKLTDEQLACFIKSRFVQSPSELQAWSQYLMDNYDKVSMEMQAMIDAQKQQASEPTEPTDPVETPPSA